MKLTEFIEHVQDAHGFDLSVVGYLQPADVTYHEYAHRVSDQDHDHNDFTVDWE